MVSQCQEWKRGGGGAAEQPRIRGQGGTQGAQVFPHPSWDGNERRQSKFQPELHMSQRNIFSILVTERGARGKNLENEAREICSLFIFLVHFFPLSLKVHMVPLSFFLCGGESSSLW